MLVSIVIFCIGILFLLKGADYFVEGGGGLAARYGVSPTTIGLTVIAFGTSLPEFVVSINAVIAGNTDVALGNVLGSNIANIGLVLGICAFLRPALAAHDPVSGMSLKRETGYMLLATLVFALLALRGVLDAAAGSAMLVVFAFIVWQLWKNGVAGERVRSHGRMDYLYTAGGLVAVAVGAQLVLDSSIAIAQALGIPAYIIGLSIVAVGTSLPELATSIVAILKGSGGISVGNLLGSNIFNLLLVMGTGALIRPVPIPDMTQILIVGGFSLAVVPLFLGTDRFTKGWALLMVAAYVLYLVLLFGTV